MWWRSKKNRLNTLFLRLIQNLPGVVQTPINAKNRILSNNKYGSGSIGFKGSTNKNEASYGFSLREIQMVLAGRRVINASEKHNLFPYIDEDKIEYLRVSQEIYKEDYYFEIKCSEVVIPPFLIESMSRKTKALIIV